MLNEWKLIDLKKSFCLAQQWKSFHYVIETWRNSHDFSSSSLFGCRIIPYRVWNEEESSFIISWRNLIQIENHTNTKVTNSLKKSASMQWAVK